jgi:hypothetical protein
VVAAPAHTRSRAGLVFGCVTLLGSGLVALLLLNVSLERGSYVLHGQQAKANQLQDEAQALREQLASLQAPQNLAAQATRLGMVPNPNAAFLRASDGKVLGVPTRAVPPLAPTVTPASAASKVHGDTAKRAKPTTGSRKTGNREVSPQKGPAPADRADTPNPAPTR